MLPEGGHGVRGGGWGKTLSPKNKQLLAVCFCVLLCLPNVAEGRKVALSRVTKPTSHRGYANADIAKLSYSPSHSAAAPAKPAPPVYSSAPAGHPHPAPPAPQYTGGGQPSYGWAPHAAPAGGNYGGAAVAGAAGTGIVAGNVYRSHGHNATGGGFGGGLAHSPPGAYPSYPAQPAQGFPGAPVQHPGGGFPAPGYQPQPGGYVPQQQPGYPHQPSYVPQPAPGGHYQGQPGQTVVHHYEQPSSGGSGIGTVLGAGAAGLAAGIGGAALYDALKPKESKEEPAATTPATTTTVAGAAPAAAEPPAPAPPANPNGEAPLAPLPAAVPNPNGEAPLAPLPSESATGTSSDTPLASTDGTPLATTQPPADGTSSTLGATSSSENPLGMAPLAPMPDASSSSSIAPPSDSSDVEVRHSALNVQPNLSASMGNAAVEPASGKAIESARISSAISLAALLPLIVRYLRF
ncbi:hypothetical protein ZHAS_00006393 [Anopheles sinensis]|uniref:Uncharacterized protein n=1 Tax=Anopheles sinensis TaxID=74873 RepID=A0A084VM76_ANOSI|nr:hypothetical protein ZHAS_00006393 [Anopheles sinensis]